MDAWAGGLGGSHCLLSMHDEMIWGSGGGELLLVYKKKNFYFI